MGKGISQTALVCVKGKPYNNYSWQSENSIAAEQLIFEQIINRGINYEVAKPPTKSFDDDMHLIA